jgi:protein arginine N-methyltransferase 5
MKLVPAFAQALGANLNLLAYTQLWIRVPVMKSTGGDEDSDTVDGPWKRWNALRSLLGHSTALVVALEIGPDLPEDKELLDRWFAEPIGCLILPTSTFLTNKQGYPVLSKAHQQVVRQYLPRNPYVVISHDVPATTPEDIAVLSPFREYMRYLHRSQPEPSVIDRFSEGFQDCLQSPLQPLMNNLEAQTYEVPVASS